MRVCQIAMLVDWPISSYVLTLYLSQTSAAASLGSLPFLTETRKLGTIKSVISVLLLHSAWCVAGSYVICKLAELKGNPFPSDCVAKHLAWRCEQGEWCGLKELRIWKPRPFEGGRFGECRSSYRLTRSRIRVAPSCRDICSHWPNA